MPIPFEMMVAIIEKDYGDMVYEMDEEELEEILYNEYGIDEDDFDE